jgi:YaiO family outer membrane protein
LTLGREGERYLTARLDAGRESYQLIGPTNVLNAFNSTAASVGWREWLGRRFGLDLGVEWYHNPFYDRTGARIGLIRQW